MEKRKKQKRVTSSRRAARVHEGADRLFESVVEALLSDSRISQAKMFGSPGLKVGGKVFAMLVKGKLVVKLSQERVETLLASGDGERFDPGHGRLMKEWIAVKLRSKGESVGLVEEAKDFVSASL